MFCDSRQPRWRRKPGSNAAPHKIADAAETRLFALAASFVPSGRRLVRERDRRSNPLPSTGESTANLSFRVGIASMTVGCEEIRRARRRHVTVGAYYKRGAGSNHARPSRPLGRCGASVREIGGRR